MGPSAALKARGAVDGAADSRLRQFRLAAPAGTSVAPPPTPFRPSLLGLTRKPLGEAKRAIRPAAPALLRTGAPAGPHYSVTVNVVNIPFS